MALTDESGKPVANAFRNTWVTETALSTALNVSYMAEQIALFGLVVGIAMAVAVPLGPGALLAQQAAISGVLVFAGGESDPATGGAVARRKGAPA